MESHTTEARFSARATYKSQHAGAPRTRHIGSRSREKARALVPLQDDAPQLTCAPFLPQTVAAAPRAIWRG
eukprot:3525476-Prymnesium_polylepis.1